MDQPAPTLPRRMLALHWELKRSRTPDARFQGPGDTLRLVHAINRILDEGVADAVDIVTISELSKVAGLFSRSGTLVSDTSLTEKEGKVRWLHLDKASVANQKDAFIDEAFTQHTLSASSYSRVIHAYIGTPLRATTSQSAQGKRLLRERIDLAYCADGVLSLPASNGVKNEKRTLVVFLRDEKAHAERNSPTWLPQVVDEAVAKCGAWDVQYRGVRDRIHAKRLGLAETAAFVPYDGSSFIEQVDDLVRCHAAVGVNSGGLDLASAAGLPVLRVGEFQDGGPSGESKEIREQHNWGRRYNRFLCVATNIGLAPHVLDMNLFPREVVSRSLVALLSASTEFLKESRHIILPAGCEFRGDTPELENYDTTAPREAE